MPAARCFDEVAFLRRQLQHKDAMLWHIAEHITELTPTSRDKGGVAVANKGIVAPSSYHPTAHAALPGR
jgi:hypothetical protein